MVRRRCGRNPRGTGVRPTWRRGRSGAWGSTRSRLRCRDRLLYSIPWSRFPCPCSFNVAHAFTRPAPEEHLETQPTDSKALARKRCRVLRHSRHRLRAWETVQKEGSDPRTSATMAQQPQRDQYTYATIRAKITRNAPATGECAEAHVDAMDEGAQVREPDPIQKSRRPGTPGREPGSRATNATSIPAAGTFSGFVRRPGSCDTAGQRQLTSHGTARRFASRKQDAIRPPMFGPAIRPGPAKDAIFKRYHSG